MSTSSTITFNVKTNAGMIVSRVHPFLTATALALVGNIPVWVEYTMQDLIAPIITTIGSVPAVDVIDGVYPEPYSEEMGELLADCILVMRSLTQFETDLLIYALAEGEQVTGADKVDALLEAFAPMSAEDMQYVFDEVWGAQMQVWTPALTGAIQNTVDLWQELLFAEDYSDDRAWINALRAEYNDARYALSRAGQWVWQTFQELRDHARATLYPRLV